MSRILVISRRRIYVFPLWITHLCLLFHPSIFWQWLSYLPFIVVSLRFLHSSSLLDRINDRLYYVPVADGLELYPCITYWGNLPFYLNLSAIGVWLHGSLHGALVLIKIFITGSRWNISQKYDDWNPFFFLKIFWYLVMSGWQKALFVLNEKPNRDVGWLFMQ